MSSTLDEKLSRPEAFLTRQDLAELGLEALIKLDGYSRPLIRVAEFERYIEEHTYRGDRVRPT